MRIPSRFRQDVERASMLSEFAQTAPSARSLTAAIAAWRDLLDRPDLRKHPDLFWTVLVNLGDEVFGRFQALGDPGDLEQAIVAYSTTLREAAAGELPYLAALQGSLGRALVHRYQVAARPEDLDDAISAYGQALAGDIEPTHRASLRNNYGLALYQRQQDRGDLADLNAAIEQFSQLGKAEDFVMRASALANLGIALRARFQVSDNPEDLDASIVAQRAALEFAEPGSANWGRWHTNLGNALHNRFEFRGERSDLHAAVAAHRSAIAALPAGSEERAGAHVNLGTTLGLGFERFGDEADLQEAIAAYETAVEAAPASSRAGTLGLSSLAGVLQLRFSLHGDRSDAERAAAVADRVLLASPPGSPAWLTAKIQVAATRRTRFAALGNRDDLDTAANAYHDVVVAAVPGSEVWARARFGLGEVLVDRYKVLGEIADLDAACESYREARAVFPSGSGNSAGVAASLAEALDHQFQAGRQLADADESIALYRLAVRLVHPGSLKWTRWQSGLGVALSLRYDALGEAEDLEAAIAVLREAVGASQRHGEEWASAQLELAGVLIERYQAGRNLDDLDGAVAAASAALAVARPGSSHWVWGQHTLGEAHRFRYDRSRDEADWDASAEAYQQVLGAVGDGLWTERALGAAAGLAELYTMHDDWEEAADAWDRALVAVAELYQSQLLLGGREAWLRRIAGIHGRAAYAQARAGRPRDAVVTLEQGRAMALSAALARERAELERVKKQDADIHRRFVEAAGRVRRLEAAQRAASGAGGASLAGEPLRQEAREARAQFETAITKVRSLPGYERFLAAPAWEEVAALTEEARTPVVYLVATWVGGLALLVGRASGEAGASAVAVAALRLDELTGASLRDLLSGAADEPGWAAAYIDWRQRPNDEAVRRTWRQVLATTTRRLWDLAMRQVVDALKSRGASQAALVPIGMLGLLPLHAAWTEDPSMPTGRRHAADELLLTYAPNARALAAARRLAAGLAPDRLLAVDEPRPVQAQPLPGAGHETAAACAAFAGHALLLRHERATRQAVTDALPHATVFHLACHGDANPVTPLDSALVLADDEPLRLRDLLDLGLAARLAVLSACDTALPGIDLPDEVVSLPAGLLQTGVAGVAASLWTVPDDRTMLLMVEFYRRWGSVREVLPPAEALRQAQRWLRDSTNGEKRELFETLLEGGEGAWLPRATAEACLEAVVLEDPDRRSFADPIGWAAFAYVGA